MVQYNVQNAAFVILLFFILTLTSCVDGRADLRPWKEGPAIALPHTVATMNGLELRIIAMQPEMAFAIRCTGTGTFDNVRIEVEKSNNSGHHAVVEAVECSGPGSFFDDQAVLQVPNTAHTGESISVSLEALYDGGSSAQGQLRGEKAMTMYMMGTDGQLRRGAGSVWR